jgi:DNA-binding MarR family transcriptional regulator
MRARALLERRDSEDDRRGATVEITPAGSEALASAAPDHVSLVRSVLFDGLTDEQLRGFDEVIGAALERLAE